VQDAGGYLNSALDTLYLHHAPREAGLVNARPAFSFDAESPSFDEKSRYYDRGLSSIHFWGSDWIVGYSAVPCGQCLREPKTDAQEDTRTAFFKRYAHVLQSQSRVNCG
jgi:hypothetical protein